MFNSTHVKQNESRSFNKKMIMFPVSFRHPFIILLMRLPARKKVHIGKINYSGLGQHCVLRFNNARSSVVRNGSFAFLKLTVWLSPQRRNKMHHPKISLSIYRNIYFIFMNIGDTIDLDGENNITLHRIAFCTFVPVEGNHYSFLF